MFSQVAGYIAIGDDAPGPSPGTRTSIYKNKYHWAWAIPIDDDVTSVGIVIPAQYFRDTKESKPDFIRRELRELNGGLAERIPEIELIETPHVIPNYSFQVRKFAGPGYMCIGDSHRFVDPIFSFGLYIAIKEAGIAADAAARTSTGKGQRLGQSLPGVHDPHASGPSTCSRT